VLLLGGHDLQEWRSDGEIWGPQGKVDVQVPDFPYKIDAPFGWWSSDGVVVCGGKNWDDDVIDARCWRYDHCKGEWTREQDLDMPYGLSGGASVRLVNSDKEELWAVGGGNGSAIPVTQVMSLEDGIWSWRNGPQLNIGRYGHCAALIKESQIFIIGGHEGENIVESIEMFDIATETITLLSDISTPSKRWGTMCLTSPEDDILLMGGMDAFFIPHANMDAFHTSSFTWSAGPKLPWAQSGGLGSILGGSPTLFGGYGMGFRKVVASFKDGSWETWSDSLNKARVSGLAVSVPLDLFDYC